MNKSVIIIFILSVFFGNAFSQNINDVFADMPEDIIPGLSEDVKNVFLDDTSSTTVSSLFGEIKRTAHTADYLKLETSDKGTVQIKLLNQTAAAPIICVIKTVCAPACDSNIRFYSNEWEPLNKHDFLPDVEGSKMLAAANKEKLIEDYGWLLPDIYFISAEFVSGSDDLFLKLNLENYLSREQYNEMKQVFGNDELLLKWKNNKFE